MPAAIEDMLPDELAAGMEFRLDAYSSGFEAHSYQKHLHGLPGGQFGCRLLQRRDV